MKLRTGRLVRATVALLLFGGAACSDPDPAPAGDPDDGASDPGGEVAPEPDTPDPGPSDPGSPADADAAQDPGADEDAPCAPRTCQAIPEACGTYDDGCGGSLTCDDACECSPETYAIDCPARPCEAATGCVERACVYAPVTCGDVACECLAESCADDALRSCGDTVCAGQYCDPRPTVDAGEVSYANVCISDLTTATCGVCGLGQLSCDPESQLLACDDMTPDLVAAGLDLDWVECESTVMSSTFVFVDPEYAGDDADGSRERPFPTVEQGMFRAATSFAFGVVIAGSPVYTQRPPLTEGISLYGGFTRDPGWRADRSQRPTWSVPYDGPSVGAEPGGTPRFIGVEVAGFEEATTLSNIGLETAAVEAAPAEIGVSNYALVVKQSPGVRLVRVDIAAGAASDGAAGEPGGDSVTPATAHGADGGERCEIAEVPPPVDEGCVVPGAAGGTAECNGAELVLDPLPNAGGAGGSGRVDCFTDGVCISGGEDGEPSAAHVCCGASGAGGAGGYGFVDGVLINPQPGESGSAAPSTAPAQAEAGIVATGIQAFDEETAHIPLAVGRGAVGYTGQAGGGGGGGGASRFCAGPFSAPPGLSSATGGGGGAGGCGGLGGSGGGAGGFSIALLVDRSDGVLVADSTFSAGAGGLGGPGERGGEGAAGGVGGAKAVPHPTDCEWCDNAGGDGGAGQPGGAGGNGAGGSSIGAQCYLSAVVLDGDNAFTPGPPGAGGDVTANAAGWPAAHASSAKVPAPAGHAVGQRGCFAECGNGMVDAGEQCDDGNTEPGDGCEPDCTEPGE